MARVKSWCGWFRSIEKGSSWELAITAGSLREAWDRLDEMFPGRGLWKTVRPKGEIPT